MNELMAHAAYVGLPVIKSLTFYFIKKNRLINLGRAREVVAIRQKKYGSEDTNDVFLSKSCFPSVVNPLHQNRTRYQSKSKGFLREVL